MSSICLLVSAALLGGAAGATANFFLSPTDDTDLRTIQKWLMAICSGIVVAFTVPLFLSLAQSTLVQQILTAPTDQPKYAEVLIFLGFCIATSFSSRSFMSRLSEQILSEVGKVKAIAKEANKKAELLEQSVGESLDSATGEAAPRATTPTDMTLQPEADNIILDASEKKALRAVGRLTMRTATGVAKDANIPRDQIGEILDQLIAKKLVEITTSKNTGGLRHRITPLGATVLNKQIHNGE